MDFYADLCFPRPGESFSVYKLCLRKKGKILRIILAESERAMTPVASPVPTPMVQPPRSGAVLAAVLSSSESVTNRTRIAVVWRYAVLRRRYIVAARVTPRQH